MSKRTVLENEQNTGKGILSALGVVAVGIIGAAIRNANESREEQRQMEEQRTRKDQLRGQLQAEIEQLKLQRNHYENEFLGKFVYSDEINAINSRIASLTNEMRAL